MAVLKSPDQQAPSRMPAVARPDVGSWLAERLGQAELRRRMFHITPGVLAYILCFVPHEDPMTLTCQVILLAISAFIAAGILYRYATIRRRGERQEQAAVLGYAFSVLGTLLLFPAQSELGMTVLAVLAFGDGCATLGGLLIRGPRLPWNSSKTWSGTACFILCGSPMAALMYMGESQPTAPFSVALLCATVATSAAALAESLPWKINDNIRVGVTASAALILMHGLVVGWS